MQEAYNKSNKVLFLCGDIWRGRNGQLAPFYHSTSANSQEATDNVTGSQPGPAAEASCSDAAEPELGLGPVEFGSLKASHGTT